jgi:hypothetical protein
MLVNQCFVRMSWAGLIAIERRMMGPGHRFDADVNVGNCYNAAGRFTAPVSAIYLFGGHLCHGNGAGWHIFSMFWSMATAPCEDLQVDCIASMVMVRLTVSRWTAKVSR